LRARSAELERQVGERTQELASVMHVGRELVSNLDSDAVLHEILTQMRSVLPYDSALVMMLENDQLVARAYQSATSQPQSTAAPISMDQYDFLPPAIADGQTREVEKVRADKSIHAFVQRYLGEPFADGSLLYAPLAVKGSALGLLFLARLQPNAFRPADRGELQQYANYVAIALANARLYTLAREQASEQERIRLAQDLHDSVTQTVFSASLITEVLPNVWQQNSARTEQNLRQLQGFMREALAELRTLLVELRPSSINLLPLGQLLTQLTDANTQRANLAFHLYIENVPALPEEVQYVFYRTAQEAINNIIKHAQASEVKVGLSANPQIATLPASIAPHSEGALQGWQGEISMTISDNGRGFDTEHPQSTSGGLGLRIMQERAESIGATLTIQSILDQGSEVKLIWRQ
jgi:signal transduction histidine kinase